MRLTAIATIAAVTCTTAYAQSPTAGVVRLMPMGRATTMATLAHHLSVAVS